MTDSKALTRDLERNLYAYVFDHDVGDRFRGYREKTRVGRFRQHFASLIEEEMASEIALFVRAVGPLSAEDVACYRVELSGSRSLFERFALWEPICLEHAARHARPSVARELFWLERAAALSRAGARRAMSELLGAIDALASGSTHLPEVLDCSPLHYVRVHSSLPEILTTPPESTSVLDAAARLPWPRHCVTYLGPIDGCVHRKCAREFAELRMLVESWSEGVDL